MSSRLKSYCALLVTLVFSAVSFQATAKERKAEARNTMFSQQRWVPSSLTLNGQEVSQEGGYHLVRLKPLTTGLAAAYVTTFALTPFAALAMMGGNQGMIGQHLLLEGGII